MTISTEFNIVTFIACIAGLYYEGLAPRTCDTKSDKSYRSKINK